MLKELISFIGNELINDQIDIEEERQNLGKVHYRGESLSDLGHHFYFVELYAEIPYNKLEFFASNFQTDFQTVITTVQERVNNSPAGIIQYVFTRAMKLNGIKPLFDKHVQTDIVPDEGTKLVTIQINLMAESQEVANVI